MAISASLIKFYQCATFAEGASHGGDIDTLSEITTATDQNIFDDVSDAGRISGETNYRKIYVRNENADTWEGVKEWIDTFTPATGDEITIKLGTNAGVQSVEGVAAGYVSPSSKVHADVLSIGDLAQNAYQSTWIKRVVTAGASGETNNSFKLACESS